jgi:L-fuculose-phosphate aldolase
MNQTARHIADIYHELGRRGFVPGSAGNVSVRTVTGMLITPSGCSADTISAEDIIQVVANETSGDGEPSSEWPVHAAIYNAIPAAQAIVHTHSEACTALACLNENLPAFHYMITAFGGDDVRCAPYVTFGTPELARAAVAALQSRSACLLANHGMIVHAPSLEKAMTDAIVLESLCRQYLLARAAGTPRLLTRAELAAARERFKTYGQNAVRSAC